MNKKTEKEKFAEIENRLYENMIKGMKIMLEFVREAAKSQDQKTIERGWNFLDSFSRISKETLREIGSSKEEIMLLTAEIFGKLPLETVTTTITIEEDRRKIFVNNPEQS
ncbi:MAG: hypothetical protein U9N04_02755 [Patescibacteria group bacterium]|nr:hypothetical protein [Patescibacteria group bacterium]